ncbi:MAG TPA: amylo-alpha-1,6-glucosidase [Candidatus Methylomirabilis sp.]|nr:amylo-alpha-1,6-glucosidase [Candidatus Methylomirabilis sp.]
MATERANPLAEIPTEIQFGREICGNLADAESREWLVTNGIGGFASGTIAASMTRRYHGLLVAALQPPLGRTHLVASLDETARYEGVSYQLATHHWSSGTIDPHGYVLLESFRLDGTTPVWTYALADSLLEKRIWMAQGENTTYVHYTLVRAGGVLELELKALVNYRDFHSSTHAGDWRMKISPVERGVMVLPFEGAVPFYLRSVQASCEPHHEWHRDCFLPMERERGLDDHEDHLFAALFRAKLNVGESVTIVATTEARPVPDGESSRAQRVNHEAVLLKAWTTQNPRSAPSAPGWLRQLILAADQFIVQRSLPDQPDGHSVIAGYHWFGDWGRDTMIALPGLTLVTGRPEIARQILLAFSRYVDAGMLPNNFPDAGGRPQYNSVDAALWYFEAVHQYFAATQDAETLQKLFPVLSGILDAHIAGTRYNIHVDPADGLLYAGGPGIQLTWMDAKVGDWVVTPRTGKPVEVNALWINALETMVQFAHASNQPADRFAQLASQAKTSFQKFWNSDRNCCFDVIDSPGSNKAGQSDPSLRPNQILGVSLPVSPLSAAQQKAVVDTCAQHLLTSNGLRSLAASEPGYQGHYSGDQRSRDGAYHQGTVWGWLLGPFALAHFRVYNNRASALLYLEPLARHISAFGLGTLPEIFDGDAPHSPRGCIAQAWTVAEILRAYSELTASH